MASMNLPKNMHLPQNMGMMDRIIRSAIGGALMMNGLSNPSSALCKIGAFIGGAFVFYGLTGYDPLLQVTDTSTLPGDNKNLINKVRSQAKHNGQHKQDSAPTLQVGGV